MSRFHHNAKQFLLLTLAAALPAGLVLFRMAYTDTIYYGFMLWNLFLAWLPLLFAWVASREYGIARSRGGLSWHWPWAGISAAAWLVFLPNAPYLITDLKHLHAASEIPILYDVTMLFGLALMGLALGFASLAWMQTIVRDGLGAWPARLFAIGVIAAASFGVYIGRFLRWNSWDILTNPGPLTLEVLRIMHHPIAYRSIWAHVALLAIFLLSAYLLLAILANFFSENAGRASVSQG